MQRLRQILSHPAIWMIVVLLAAYWQVALCRYTLQWDMTDQAFPWHRYISECFHAHIIPLWAPYSKLGYPIYADPQSGLFYPTLWLVGTLTRYTLYSNNWELVIHIILAAFGMRYLLQTLGLRRWTAAVFGLVYAMSGPFLGHASHITLIGSLCWIPWLAAAYIRFLRGYLISDLLLVALFAFMQLTGGYAGITIIMLYVMTGVLVYYTVHRLRTRTMPFTKAFIMHIGLGITAILLSAGFLYAVAQGQPYIDRGEGVSRATAGHLPFSPACLITMVYPPLVGSQVVDFDTNITMQSLYIGFIPLLLLIACVIVRRRSSTYVILLGSLLLLLAAMGDHTPVRGLLYDYLPGMRLFRHAGIFRFFSCIGFIVLAGMSYDSIADMLRSRSSFKNLGILGTMLSMVIVADMMISVQDGMHKTVISDRRLATIQSYLDQYPQGFPIPDNNSIIACNEWNDSTIAPPIWHNAGFIRKQISFEGDNRFQLRNYATIHVQRDFFQRYERRKMIEADGAANIRMTGFAPGRFTFAVVVDVPQTVTMAQMYFPGWSATVDGHPAAIAETPDHFVSCRVDGGMHQVEMSFAPAGAGVAFVYTIGAVLLTGTAIVLLRRRGA